MMRSDGRGAGELRKIKLIRGTMKFADASCEVSWGKTKVICTATKEDRVPPFLRNTATGWITAEYGMLPGSSKRRIEREAVRGRLTGRTQEIQRLIGRSLRVVVDLKALGERTIIVDCDVIQADGGTRCASITGGFVALVDLLKQLKRSGVIPLVPVKDFLAATSVGIVRRRPMLDLAYIEDVEAEVDMNVVMTGNGQFVELQGTAERQPFNRGELERLLRLSNKGVRQLVTLQRRALGISPTGKF